MSIQYNRIENLKVTQNFKAKGVPNVYKFSFNYDTPDLNIGVPIYTPSVGEVLLDAWTDTTTDFDGTGLRWDLGTFNPLSDDANSGMMGFWYDILPVLSDTYYYDSKIDYHMNNGYPNSFSTVSAQYTHEEGYSYPWQTVFDTTSPLKLVVSQDGHSTGQPIGGTQGSATLYISVVKPKK